jgi:hypothetical protein
VDANLVDDFWNCKHIANPNKFNRIRLCNTTLGLLVPALVPPNQLIGDFYMIENSPIIQDIRKIRKAISEKFGHDSDR